MRTPLASFHPLVIGLAAFLGFGPCMACLSAMEQRMGLIGKEARLVRTKPAVSIPFIGENLSGITWNHDTETLFAVTNSPQSVHELTPDGGLLRSIPLEGFSDTEDIASMGGGLFALIEERRGFIRLIRITDATTSIRIEDSSGIDLGSRHEDNKGFESLYFDHATRTLLTMRELPPYELVSVSLNAENKPARIRRIPLSLDLDDVAALSRDGSGNLWILSEASSRLIRLDEMGRTEHLLSLKGGASFEPEGLTFGTDGSIFIAGEPNIVFISSLTNL